MKIYTYISMLIFLLSSCQVYNMYRNDQNRKKNPQNPYIREVKIKIVNFNNNKSLIDIQEAENKDIAMLKRACLNLDSLADINRCLKNIE